MQKSSALEKLSSLLSRTAEFQNQKEETEPFQKWQRDVRATLKYVFPKNPDYQRDFDDISYFPGMIMPGRTPDKVYRDAFQSGLSTARAMLQSQIDEVSQFWPDDKSPDENPPAIQVPIIVSSEPTRPGDVFVIHGRQLIGDFHDFLRSLGLKPLEWSAARELTRKPTPYTWEIVDTALTVAGAIVALFTPDDEARLRQHLWSEHEQAMEKEFLSQPRQNVLFEAGVAFGRRPERTVLIRVGSHRPISDLAGHHIIQLDDSPQSRQAVADALRAAGCVVDTSGSDWYKSGKFSLSEPIQTATGQAIPTTKDMATLRLYKVQVKGSSDLTTGAKIVGAIHGFFAARPEYLNVSNSAFLIKYPLDFFEQVTGNYTIAITRWSLEQLQQDIDTLALDESD